MEQEAQKPRLKRPSRIGCLLMLIPTLLALIVSLWLFAPLTGLDFPYSYIRSIIPAPIVTLSHSAQELWDNPQPTPEWITWVKSIYDDPPYSNDFYNYPFCVAVSLSSIWDWEVRDPEQLLERTTGITVDGVAIARFNISFWGVGGVLIQCSDNKCNIDEPNRISFNVPSLEPGLHTVTIRIENNAGVPYSYEWAFRVKEDAND